MWHSSQFLRRSISIAALAIISIPIYAVTPPPIGGYPIENTATGDDSLFSLTSGTDNTALGFDALFSTTTGSNNTAVGSLALQHNTKGVSNTAVGLEAMKSNSTGKANVAFGVDTLIDNISGYRNVAIGTESLKRTTGFDNVGLGYEAGMNVTTGSFTICIGNMGLASDTNLIRIGTEGVQTAIFVAGIKNTAIAGTAVGITADGKLGIIASSARFKEAVKPMDKASEAIFSLQPVEFRYKKELDPQGIPRFGLVAEEVAEVAPDLVVTDAQSRPFTVRYDEVNAMLLNEFLKEHAKVARQGEEIDQLKAAVARLEQTLKEQTHQTEDPAARGQGK